MAITVAFDGTQMSSADTSTDGGTWDLIGATQTPAQEDNFYYNQESGSSTFAQSDKASNNTGGVDFDYSTTVDMATTPKVVLAIIACTTPGQMNATAKGMAYYVGSSGSDYYEYYLWGLYNEYPAVGGFQFVVIDPNQAAYRDAVQGTPALGSADYFGWYIDMTGSGSIKAENAIHDTLSYMDIGTGLTLTGNTPDGVFQDFLDFDPDTVTNRHGVITYRGNAIFANGVLTIGSSGAATTFTDSNKQIFFPNHLVNSGFCGLDLDIQNASSTITISNTTFVGEGRGDTVRDFHTNDDVDATNNEVDITAHGYETGDYVDYSKQSGTDSMGLTDGNDYWVRAVTVDAISFHTTRQGAFADTSQVTLSQSGGTEDHRLTKLTDTRPDMVVTGTSGTAALDGCSFLNHRNVTFTSAASQDGGRIEAKLLTQSSADIENLTIVTDALPGVATLQDPTFGTSTDLHDVNFVQGSTGDGGHAIEIDTATSYTFTNIGFSGYGVTTSDQAALYVSATSGTVTITVSGGDTPTYKTDGATVSINSDVTVTFTGMKDTTEVRVYTAGTTTELAGIETVTAGSPDDRSFDASVAATTSVDYWIFAVGYVPIMVKAFTWPSTNGSIPIQQIVDRNYSNP